MDYPDLGLAKIKETERQLIRQQIEAFIASGGRIEQIDSRSVSKTASPAVEESFVVPTADFDYLGQ